MPAHSRILLWLACVIAPVQLCSLATAGAVDQPGSAPVAEGELDEIPTSEPEASHNNEILGPPSPMDVAPVETSPAETSPAGKADNIVPPIKRVKPKPAPGRAGESAKSKVKKAPAGEASVGKPQKKSP
jgi:hypothetical protein